MRIRWFATDIDSFDVRERVLVPKLWRGAIVHVAAVVNSLMRRSILRRDLAVHMRGPAMGRREVVRNFLSISIGGALDARGPDGSAPLLSRGME